MAGLHTGLTMPYSIHQRPELLLRLQSEIFDVVVVGGGITGAGVARDAALRGLKVALIDRGDFACGTSSRSSKLIHGGVRYLEMGDVALVFEAVRERQRLLRLAPHLARPQSFLLPVYEDRKKHSVFILDVGLTLYDLLASFAGVMHHRALRTKAMRRLEPLLRAKGLDGGVRFWDAMTDDARLVMANLRGALQAGAVPVSRVAFVEPVWKNNRLLSVRLRDELTGHTFLVATHTVVSATGPWTDELHTKWKGSGVPQTLQPSKGVHVVVPRERLPLSQAVMMTAADGRVVFALPWPLATVLGTTDTPYAGDFREPEATYEDAKYLVDTANAHFDTPDRPLDVEDVVSTWAGIRPLVANTQTPGSTYKTSREHVVSTDPRGLVTIAGGKLTTYRVMAQSTVDAVVKLLPPTPGVDLKPCQTETLPLPGADKLVGVMRPLETLIAGLQAQENLDESVARHLAMSYGSDARDVLATCDMEPAGRQRVLPDLPFLWGELAWLTREEMVLTLTDLCVRRTQLYYLAGEKLLTVAPLLADRLVKWLGLPAEKRAELLTDLENFVAARRVQPPVTAGQTDVA